MGKRTVKIRKYQMEIRTRQMLLRTNLMYFVCIFGKII